jgi:hypothetical protein
MSSGRQAKPSLLRHPVGFRDAVSYGIMYIKMSRIGSNSRVNTTPYSVPYFA